MDPWTELKHYPVIKATQEQIILSNNININILLENVNAIDKMVGIPLTFTIQGYFSNMPIMWLLPQFAINNVLLQSFDNETCIIINTLQAGEYKQLNSLYFL